MESQRIDKLKKILEEIEENVSEDIARKLELEKSGRIIERLGSFSPDCEACLQHLDDIEMDVNQLKEKSGQFAESDFNHHKQRIKNISSHLQKQHKLVPSGYYLGLYMSIGTSLGIIFGLILFENIALGLPFGIAVGVALGAGLDADAKKKGMTL